MKKFEVKSLLALLLVLIMAFAMVACGDEVVEGPDTEPVVTDPTDTDPVDTDPIETDPIVTDPVDTDPVDPDDPDETDPKYDPIETDPIVTDPIEPDPGDTDPVVTEPVETEPPHTHNFVKSDEVAATCQAAGSVTYVCECGETKTETKPKTDHSYAQTVLSYATCTVDGEVVSSCIYCGDVKSVIDVTPATGHTYVPAEKEIASPTHHKGIVKVCHCGEMLDEIKYTEAHDFVCSVVVPDVVAPSGDIDFGYELYECECGYTKKIGSNSAAGHFFYLDEGSGKYVCACGEALVGELATVYNGNPNAGYSIFPKN